MKRIGVMLLCISILGYGTVMQHASLQTYKVSQDCCCESNCDCPTNNSTIPIFRNIQCGDNGSTSGALPGTQDLYITQYIVFPLNIHVIQSENSKHKTDPINNDTIDPPPPKKHSILT
jgi:hypothetical protein